MLDTMGDERFDAGPDRPPGSGGATAARLADALRDRLGDEFHPEFLIALAAALAAGGGSIPDRLRRTMTPAEARAALDVAARAAPDETRGEPSGADASDGASPGRSSR